MLLEHNDCKAKIVYFNILLLRQEKQNKIKIPLSKTFPWLGKGQSSRTLTNSEEMRFLFCVVVRSFPFQSHSCAVVEQDWGGGVGGRTLFLKELWMWSAGSRHISQLQAPQSLSLTQKTNELAKRGPHTGKGSKEGDPETPGACRMSPVCPSVTLFVHQTLGWQPNVQ